MIIEIRTWVGKLVHWLALLFLRRKPVLGEKITDNIVILKNIWEKNILFDRLAFGKEN